jgi:hypothetical protein
MNRDEMVTKEEDQQMMFTVIFMYEWLPAAKSDISLITCKISIRIKFPVVI